MHVCYKPLSANVVAMTGGRKMQSIANKIFIFTKVAKGKKIIVPHSPDRYKLHYIFRSNSLKNVLYSLNATKTTIS